MTNTRCRAAVLAVLALGVVCSGGSLSVAKSAAAPVPVIVELFTSEGCSSCPPADQLLIELIQKQPVKDALVIGLSEHVDYWNQLGWKDPFSDHLFSARQSAYAASAGTADVYTPQMVVDGHDSFVGSDRAAALAAIARAAAMPKTPMALSWTTATPRTLKVSLNGGASSANGTVFLAVVEDDLQSSVRAGENSGVLLRHSAVTRRLTEIGRADRTGAFANENVRVELAPAWRPEAVHAVVFVAGTGRRVVAAASIRP